MQADFSSVSPLDEFHQSAQHGHWQRLNALDERNAPGLMKASSNATLGEHEKPDPGLDTMSCPISRLALLLRASSLSSGRVS